MNEEGRLLRNWHRNMQTETARCLGTHTCRTTHPQKSKGLRTKCGRWLPEEVGRQRVWPEGAGASWRWRGVHGCWFYYSYLTRMSSLVCRNLAIKNTMFFFSSFAFSFYYIYMRWRMLTKHCGNCLSTFVSQVIKLKNSAIYQLYLNQKREKV